MNKLKKNIKKIPVLIFFIRLIMNIFRKKNDFPGAEVYWDDRYSSGNDSGSGSYNRLAKFKADFINSFVYKNSIKSVVEFGVGDGNQLKMCNYEKYIGYDVSIKAIEICIQEFKFDTTKTFKLVSNYEKESADLTLSLDVIYHLVEDNSFKNYMNKLFESSNLYVIIYSSNGGGSSKNHPEGYHIKHRKFTDWVEQFCKDWKLIEVKKNPYPYSAQQPDFTSFADFYIYKKNLIS